jgi:hypothetical protein
LTDYGVVRRGFLCVPPYNVRRLAVHVHQGPSRAVLARFWVFRLSHFLQVRRV